MTKHTRIYSANIKTRKDFYLSTAIVNIYTDGEIEFCAYITDGSKPTPYLDMKKLQVVHPPGRAKTIIRPAGSWADALQQLQALADEYGTLATGAGIMPLAYTKDDEETDE